MRTPHQISIAKQVKGRFSRRNYGILERSSTERPEHIRLKKRVLLKSF